MNRPLGPIFFNQIANVTRKSPIITSSPIAIVFPLLIILLQFQIPTIYNEVKQNSTENTAFDWNSLITAKMYGPFKCAITTDTHKIR